MCGVKSGNQDNTACMSGRQRNIALNGRKYDNSTLSAKSVSPITGFLIIQHVIYYYPSAFPLHRRSIRRLKVPNQSISVCKTKFNLALVHPHLASHDQARGLVADFVDHSSISSTQLAYWFEIFILQLPNLSFLGEEGFQAFALLFVQVQLPEFLL